MAFETPGRIVNLPAGADLSNVSNCKYRFVKLQNDGTVVLCNGATDEPYGILQNSPTAGQLAQVMRDGISKVQADAALAVADKVGTSADGQAAVYTHGASKTNYIMGTVILAAGAAGRLATIDFSCVAAPRGVLSA